MIAFLKLKEFQQTLGEPGPNLEVDKLHRGIGIGTSVEFFVYLIKPFTNFQWINP